MGKIIVANWKMNGSKELLHQCLSLWPEKALDHQVIVCPPAPLIAEAQTLIHNNPRFYVGAQDCHDQEKGAYTGCISATLLKEMGCTYVIIGHSERRQQFHENNDLILKKIEQASRAQLVPILCVGETWEDRQAARTPKVIGEQLHLPCVYMNHFIIAYEPLWAIGTGKTPAIEDIHKTHRMIRNLIHSPRPILYGGSVTGENAHAILADSEVDGVLVGGTSLKPQDFSSLLQIHV